MKVYIAASFSRQKEMQDVARRLLFAGVDVNSRWLHEDQSLDHSPEFLRICALKDIEDVQDCDVFVRFSDDLHFPLVYSHLATGARHFEMGLAWVLGKEIIVVSGKQQIFDHLEDIIHLPDENALIDYFTGVN